jgi:hypothetical protein
MRLDLKGKAVYLRASLSSWAKKSTTAVTEAKGMTV